MVERKVGVTVSDVEEKLSLDGITESAVEIDYSGDVDFTNLVDLLIDFIDDGTSFTLILPNEFKEGKIAVVLDALSKIFTKYNNSLVNINEYGQTEMDLDVIATT